MRSSFLKIHMLRLECPLEVYQDLKWIVSWMTRNQSTMKMTQACKKYFLKTIVTFYFLSHLQIFGEVVLGLSQGSVSELLSKPKPWHMLSIKGREPFIRMQLWLSDPNNIDKLQTLKNERREANKRRRTNIDDTRGASSTRDSPLYNFNSNSSGFSPLSSGQSPFPSSGNNTGYMSSNNNNNSGKKPRILFSDEQKEALRLAFSMDSYPTQSTIEFLSSELGLSSKTITNWFHNHRMRLKQVPNSGTSSDPDSSPAVNSLPFVGLNRDGATFDTVQFRVLLAQRLADASARGSRATNHSDKVSKFHSGIFGSVDPSGLSSRLYGNPNSCSSPGSSSSQGADDEYQRGTLDLSMTSSQQLKKISSGSNRSLAGDSDRSRNSFDDEQESDQSPLQLDLHHRSSPSLPPPPAQSSSPIKSGSSRRKPQVVMSSSSRRKPAQPQRSWIDTQFSGDEDEDEAMNDNDADDDDLSDSEPVSRSRKDVINGVCVRLPASSDKNSFTSGKRKTSEEWDQDEEDDSQSIDDGADGIRTWRSGCLTKKSCSKPSFKVANHCISRWRKGMDELVWYSSRNQSSKDWRNENEIFGLCFSCFDQRLKSVGSASTKTKRNQEQSVKCCDIS